MNSKNNIDYIPQLITRKLTGMITTEENDKLDAWLTTPANQQLFDRMREEFQNKDRFKQRTAHINATADWKLVKERLVEPKKNLLFVPLIKYAAAVLTLVLIGIGLYIYQSSAPSIPIAEAGIQPGGNRATLTLTNGINISLSEQKKGIIIQSNEIVYDDGTPVQLQAASHKSQDNVNTPTPLPVAIGNLNTLTTPIGGEYQVILPDGTKVHLNAATTLQYPTHFSGETREVALSGEAYFEVAKDETKQFIVHAGENDIAVLGTTFNISAYPDDMVIATTLAEGHVQVKTPYTAGIIDLTPGRQALYHTNNKEIALNDVDVAIYTAWIDGKFYFEKENLETIIKKLGRWYAFEAEYQDVSLKNKTFRGVALRNRPLQHVLDMISATTDVAFKIEGKRLIVMSN